VKIAVCVKAVPDAAAGRRIDAATKRLDRSGELVISDFDTYAVEEGLKLKEAAGDGHSDDVASIAEVTRRRFLRHGKDSGGDLAPEAALDPQTGRPRRFAYPPNLFVVDGGAPQVAAAAEVLDELGVTDVAVVGLAKRLEEVWVPGESDPVILPRTSESLFLLQRVRDEAHRFANTYHQLLMKKRIGESVLDDCPGVSQNRKNLLLRKFGSVNRLRKASVEQIAATEGIGPKLAEDVHRFLARH
jgi:excinuclease ABC subunit C